ncbi:MAG TPA: PKD domain-containing protein [Bacteroidales bacterium]|nr:PKD domain-containing protein [Bacteroidales bacterium]HSA44784.1 PKD domain-containing protein [Bacteroidales bacterium]
MKRILPLFVILFLTFQAVSQTYLINNYNGQTITTCTGRLYDSGGAGGNYGNSQNFTVTICSGSPTNTHVKLYFWNFAIDVSDTLYIYDGNSTAAPLIGKYNNNNTLFLFPVQSTAANASGCLTVQFVSNGSATGAGFEAEISCQIACQTVISSIDSIMTIPHPADSNYIDICYGDTITFVAKGVYPQNGFIYPQSDATSTFIWNLGDGTIVTGQSVTHVYNMIRGYNVELVITDVQGCVSMNALGTRVRVSDDPIGHVGTLPDICSGTDLNITVGYSSLNNINVTVPSYYQSASLKYDSATFIPDGGALGGQCFNTFVTFNCFNPGQTVSSASDVVAIHANMEHSFVGDLEMKLICPNGQSVILKEYIQSGGAYLGVPLGGVNHTNFDCAAPPSCITDPAQNPPGTGWTYTFTFNSPQYNTMQSYANTGNATPPPPGGNQQIDSSSYTPYEPWTGLIGCPLNGTWNFQVCDYWGIDNGWVFWWELELDPNILPVNWGYSVPIDYILWNGPFITQNTGTTLTIHPDTGGVFNYQVFITDKFGCTYDTLVPVNVVTTPEIDLGSDTSTCEGNQIMLTAPDYPNATYYWLPNGDTTKTVTATTSGDYVAIIQTGNGNVMCLGQDTIHVGYFPAPLINFQIDTMTGCEPVTVHFENGSLPKSAQFQWTLGDGNYSTDYSPTHTYNAGTYSVKLKVISGEGCEDSYTLNDIIQVYQQPVADFVMFPEMVNVNAPVVTFTNLSTGGVNPLWKFGDGETSTEENPEHAFPSIGVFDVWLVYETEHGCVDSLMKSVNVIDDSITIPNIITPNGDGKNDNFVVENIEAFLTNEFIVYDRWGKKVYEQFNYRNDWNGGGLPDGTYYIILRGHGLLRNVEYTGVLTILSQ